MFNGAIVAAVLYLVLSLKTELNDAVASVRGIEGCFV